jgi:hypothetical protein
MILNNLFARLALGGKSLALAAFLIVSVASTGPQAQAATIFLDFVGAPTTDIFGVGTTTADFSPYSFAAMTTSQIHTSILEAVQLDYIGYPNFSGDASSPLPDGKRLDVDFLLAGSFSADPEYYFFNIGNNTTGNSFLGQACFTCVRNASGSGPSGAATGDIVGSILVNNIAALAAAATTDTQRINLLAGTVSHEIGHALSLEHLGIAANPGESAYSLMGTGAAPISMPNAERLKDRAFAYTQFSQLIDAVGTRDMEAVPEPGEWALFSSGLLLVFGLRTRRSR